MGLKELLLQKGWAGRTISRPETIERLNPILRIMTELMHKYGAVRDEIPAGIRPELERELKMLRADIGKVAETVFSCGGVAYSGTDLEPKNFEVGENLFSEIRDAENVLGRALSEEQEVEHQMRTRAILGAVAQNHENRLNLINAHA